ncbi:MAG: F0F1 ATP synthase subunit delta [Candidatus Moranbacteria bacterium]|nr:F0F1 ATP synthase subunit delta [Candidatus Moranbacteria bacterium]
MRPTVSQYARSLEELSQGATGEVVSVIAKNFAGFLRRRGEEKKLPAILKQLQKIEAEKEGRIAVTAILAHSADEATKKKLSLRAERLFPKKKVELSYTIDGEMIGGVVFRTDEVLYDATLLNEISLLKKSLLKA